MTDQTPGPWPSTPPLAPMEGAAANRRSRTPLVVGIVLAVVAAGVVIVLLAGGGDDGDSGAGEVSGTLPGDDGAVTREVTVPASSVLVVRATPDEDLDLTVSVLGDEAAFAAADDLAGALTEEQRELDGAGLDDEVADALIPFLSAGDEDDFEELEEDDVDEALLDTLPPALVLRVDDGGSGGEEVFLFVVLEETELTLAFTGYDGDEGPFDATLRIVELDAERGDADSLIEAMAADEELADLVG